MVMVQSAEFITVVGKAAQTFSDLLVLTDYDHWCFTFELAGTDMRMKLPMYILQTGFALGGYSTVRDTMSHLHANLRSALKSGQPPVQLLEYAMTLVVSPEKANGGSASMSCYTDRMFRNKSSERESPAEEWTLAGICDSLDKVSEVLGMASNDPCVTVGKILTRPLGSDLEWQEVPDLLKPPQ